MTSGIRSLTAILLLTSLFVKGQSPGDLIPLLVNDEMKKNACATIYNQDIELEIKPDGEALWTVDLTVTVWNEKGDDHGNFITFYDEFRTLKDFNGSVYNSSGKKIKRIYESDLEDNGAVSNSFVADIRMKSYKPLINEYPYTVNYRYTLLYRSTLFIKEWMPQPNYYVSVVNSTLTAVDVPEYPLLYEEINITNPVELLKKDNRTTFKWAVSALPARKYEPISPPLREIMPRVLIKTENFLIDGYKGRTETWQAFGNWLYHLNKGRQGLSPKTEALVREIAGKAINKKEVVCRLYQHLQNNTRYVSIQLGIGGYQPEEARIVDEVGYGDCKALSNYMVSLLDAAGINAHYVLVNSGINAAPVEEDFPSNQFDHVIVCVPLGKDTIWLECTSQSAPCGFLGGFTGDRKALIIEEGESRLVTTPSYSKENNTQCRSATVRLDSNGDGSAEIITVYSGLQYDNIEEVLRERMEEQEKYIYKNIDIPKFKINRFNYSLEEGTFPQATESLDLYLDRFMAMSGSRAFLYINLMNRFSGSIAEDTSRMNKVRTRFPFIDTDTITYILPEGFSVEAIPDPVSLEYPFASYKMQVNYSGESLVFTRHLEVERGTWPVQMFPEFVEFYQKLSKADKAMAVLIKH